MKSIKRRKLNTWNKRIYIQDKELTKTKFTPGIKYNAYYIPKLKKIYLIPSDTGTRTVSKRTYNTNSVIDIKSLEAMSKLQEYETLKIELFKDKIIIGGLRTGSRAVYQINSKYLNSSNNENDILKVISICSGAGFLDLGFKQEGFEIVYALEREKDMYETYKANFGDHIVHGDLNLLDVETLPDADALVGGIPCKDYSNANRTTGKIIDSPNNLLIRKYIEIAEKKKSLSAFVLENVPQILTKGKKFIEELKERLTEYKITIQVLDAKYFGSPQTRKRAIILGSKLSEIVMSNDLSRTTFQTLREAFKYLTNDTPNQDEHTKSKDETLEIIKQIKPGENYNTFIGKDKRHSSVYKRFEYDKPTCTITHIRKSMMLHPKEDRVLTIREAARLFDIPDEFVFYGTLDKKYEMIANGVPVNMARAIARKVKENLLLVKTPSTC